MKTILIVRVGIIDIKIEEKTVFSTILVFTSGWDYKHYNKYISQKTVNSSSTSKIHLKCDVPDGSIQIGVGEPILCSFVLDKKPSYKLFCEPETIHFTKQITLF